MFPNALIMEIDYFFLTAQSQKFLSLESALSVNVYMPGEKTCIFEPKKSSPDPYYGSGGHQTLTGV